MFLDRLVAFVVFIFWVRSLVIAYQSTKKRQVALDAEELRTRRKEERLWWGLALFLTAYAAFFFYFGPKAAGEKFVNALRFGDAGAIYEVTCSNSEVHQSLEKMPNGLFLVTATIEEEHFKPFVNRYEFSGTFKPLFGTEERGAITLQIKLVSPWRFCVEMIESERR